MTKYTDSEYQEKVVDAFKSVVSTESGRFLMSHIIGVVCNVDGTVMATDSNQTSFNLGMRNVGLELKRLIRVSAHAQLSKMREEFDDIVIIRKPKTKE